MGKVVCEITYNGEQVVKSVTTFPGTAPYCVRTTPGPGKPYWYWESIPAGKIIGAASLLNDGIGVLQNLINSHGVHLTTVVVAGLNGVLEIAAGSLGGLGEGDREPLRPLSCPARAPLAGPLVVAGTKPGPRGQMTGTRKHRHVGADVFPCHVLTQREFRCGNLRSTRLTEICGNTRLIGQLAKLDFRKMAVLDDRLIRLDHPGVCMGNVYPASKTSPVWGAWIIRPWPR